MGASAGDKGTTPDSPDRGKRSVIGYGLVAASLVGGGVEIASVLEIAVITSPPVLIAVGLFGVLLLYGGSCTARPTAIDGDRSSTPTEAQ